jgi:hypothetical protein
MIFSVLRDGKLKKKTQAATFDYFKENRNYWKLREEVLDRTVRRTRFVRGCGPIAKETT